MKVRLHEVVKDEDGGTHFEVHEVERTYPGEGQGRHSKLCEICGFSTHPKCRENCPNGDIDKSQG